MVGIKVNHIFNILATYSIIWCCRRWRYRGDARDRECLKVDTYLYSAHKFAVVGTASGSASQQQEGKIIRESALNKWDIKFTHPCYPEIKLVSRKPFCITQRQRDDCIVCRPCFLLLLVIYKCNFLLLHSSTHHFASEEYHRPGWVGGLLRVEGDFGRQDKAEFGYSKSPTHPPKKERPACKRWGRKKLYRNGSFLSKSQETFQMDVKRILITRTCNTRISVAALYRVTMVNIIILNIVVAYLSRCKFRTNGRRWK